MCCNRPKKSRSVDVRPALAALAAQADPPVALDPYLKVLRNAGVEELYIAGPVSGGGALIELSTAAATGEAALMARARRFVATDWIDWDADAPLREALDRLQATVRGFDRLTRFRLAASDMDSVARAAAGLVEAHDQRGPARYFDRVIETGMVVTYVRPFLETNEAGIGRKWWPTDSADLELHSELVELRHEYHAHAAHTPQRRLEFTNDMRGDPNGRTTHAESWTRLPVWKLQALEDLANRLGASFVAEVDRLDLELFGPRDH
jgi:hypothetical protein